MRCLLEALGQHGGLADDDRRRDALGRYAFPEDIFVQLNASLPKSFEAPKPLPSNFLSSAALSFQVTTYSILPYHFCKPRLLHKAANHD